MKKELTVTAKTVEEARKKAAEELGLSEDALEVAVLEEGKKGFLGIGSAEAKITVSYEISGEDLAFNFIKKVIKDVELDLTVAKKPGNNDDVLITVDGEGAGLLIGHHGETLDALQYLANLAANQKSEGKKQDYVRITLDIEGYRAKREETLRILARKTAKRVLKEKRSVMLEPMNPYERRIIHSEVQGIAGVTTNSIGNDNNRRVVMFLDDGSTEPNRNTKEDDSIEAAAKAETDRFFAED